MASEVDICNTALSHIGQDANVTSIDPPDSTAEADHCSRWYPIARDALLESHAWNFATRRIQLAEVTNDLVSWRFAYAWPDDCLRPLCVLLPQATDDTKGQDFVVETNEDGDKIIYSNTEDAVLKFIIRVTDTTKFSPLVVMAVSRLLASYLCGPITKNMKDAATQREFYEKVDLPNARASDANGQKNNAYGQKHRPEFLSIRQT